MAFARLSFRRRSRSVNSPSFLRGYVANAKELLPDSASERPVSDTERYASCFARAYVHWGSGLDRHVLGEYAVAIYDASKRVLLLAHDALGLVPLYYRLDGSGITFTSHLDMLVRRNGGQRLDEEYVADYLCYGDHYGERTPYLDVKRLERGITIEYSARGLVRRKSWGLCLINRIRYSDIRDYCDHLRKLVTASVEAAVPGDTTTWCELSGGLDSSTVLGIVARLASARGLRSISFVYPESRTADESDYIRAVVDKCGVTPVFLNAMQRGRSQPYRARSLPSPSMPMSIWRSTRRTTTFCWTMISTLSSPAWAATRCFSEMVRNHFSSVTCCCRGACSTSRGR